MCMNVVYFSAVCSVLCTAVCVRCRRRLSLIIFAQTCKTIARNGCNRASEKGKATSTRTQPVCSASSTHMQLVVASSSSATSDPPHCTFHLIWSCQSTVETLPQPFTHSISSASTHFKSPSSALQSASTKMVQLGGGAKCGKCQKTVYDQEKQEYKGGVCCHAALHIATFSAAALRRIGC